MITAALYLRSSKDRSDVSISAQRNSLQDLAKERGLQIVAEYVDVVESAKSEHRPAFQDLSRELKRPGRPWKVIMMIDHSRLSRQPYVGHVFRYEAAKHGAEVIFANMPDLDPISRVVMDSVLDAFAVVHSIMSKQKGLAGMAENIRSGWRAGGRAPRGYRLKKIATGAMREGEPVTKSVLEPSEDAPVMARYLQGRARGIPRAQLIADLGLQISPSSLIGMEWNALTYAGHTVWNRHNETVPGRGYKDSAKMRPREAWQVHRDTHEALITDQEAEAILDRLANSRTGQAVSAAKRGQSNHLLSGVLAAPDGRLWEGWRDRYRVKARNGHRGRQIPQAPINEAITQQITADISSDRFVEALHHTARRMAGSGKDPTKQLRADLVALNNDVSRAMELALQLKDPAPALRKVDELEARRQALSAEISRVEKERAAEMALQAVTKEQIREIVGGVAEQFEAADPHRLKRLIQSTIVRIVLDPQSLECKIHYRISMDRTLSMASPRRRDSWGALRAVTEVLMARAG